MEVANLAKTLKGECPEDHYPITYKKQNFVLKKGCFLWVMDDRFFEVPDGHDLIKQGDKYYIVSEQKVHD